MYDIDDPYECGFNDYWGGREAPPEDYNEEQRELWCIGFFIAEQKDFGGILD
jgi:hypothetical protein